MSGNTAFLSKNTLYFKVRNPLRETVRKNTTHLFPAAVIFNISGFFGQIPPQFRIRKEFGEIDYDTPRPNNSIFISKIRKCLFTFTVGCVNIYVVKIGNYFGFSQEKRRFPRGISGKFIVFNFFLILINCSRSGLQLIENRRMLLKICPAYLPKISQSKS